ncbi:hypothetical protein HKD37_12G034046 [Glycine soja]
MANTEPLDASLDRLEAAMTNHAVVDSDLHASHLPLGVLHASMLFKLDLISLKLDTLISRQPSLSPFSMQPPPPPPPLFPPLVQPPPPSLPLLPPPSFPPSAQPTLTPRAPPPRSHVPPPMAEQQDSPVIGINSSTIDFPVSVWQHRVDLNRHFRSIQLWPLPLRTNPRRYRKIPYENDIFLLGDAAVAHRIRPHWIWILFATETPLCSVRHRRQRPPPHPPPPLKPPPPPSSPQPWFTHSLTVPPHGSHTLLQKFLLLGPNQPTNKATALTYLLFPKLTPIFRLFLIAQP